MDHTPWKAKLTGNPWFDSLRPDMVELMLSLAVERRYRPDQVVYRANDPSSGFYGILSGGVRLSQYTPSGRHVLYSTFNPGTWFGIISEFDDLPRPHTAIAVEPTRLLHISSTAFQEIASRDWRYCFDMARSVVALFRVTLSVLSETRMLPYPVRVAQTLLAMADHESAQVGGEPAAPKLTQDDLAAMVDVTRQTISRLLTQWESQGVVERRYGRVRLLDTGRLLAIAEGA